MLVTLLIYNFDLTSDLHKVTIFLACSIHINCSAQRPLLYYIIFVQIMTNTGVNKVKLFRLVSLLFYKCLSVEYLHELSL